jgi:hypothetical protein
MPLMPTFVALQELDPIPFCAVTNSIDQVIPRITPTIHAFDTTDDDVTGMHDLGDNSKINILLAGVYIVHVNVQWEPNGTGNRTIRVFLNGGLWEQVTDDAESGGNFTNQQMFSVGRWAAGDFLQIEVEHNATPLTLDSVAAVNVPHFAVIWQGL